MSLIQKAGKFVHNPWLAYSYATAKGLTKWVPDKPHLKMMYRATIGYWPDLENPKTFNEKLQWLKLHDRNPLYTTLVDKYRVKQWVADRIGEQYVTTTYAAWDRAEDIDISGLPDRFVLKTNHDCGGIVICRDKEAFDLDAAKAKLAAHLKRNYYWGGREWPYKNVEPLVFAEEYLEDIRWELQTWNFGGEPKMVAAIKEPHGVNEKRFYDGEWVELPFVSSPPALTESVPKPERLAGILDASRTVSSSGVFARVDFVDSSQGLKLGEITLYPAAGFVHWTPSDYDSVIGKWLKLPECAGGGYLLVKNSSCMWLRKGTSVTSGKGLTDYKIMCFGGEAYCEFTCTGRAEGDLRVDFFDREWNRLPFTRHYPNAEIPPEAPGNLKGVLELAQKLAADIPFVRVDFYEVAGRSFFGEMTFYPGGGFEEFEPVEWDSRVGSWMELPESVGGGVSLCER